MLDRTRMLVVTAALAAVTPSMAHAQKLGQGGTGVDETTAVPQCQVPLGVAALVEEKAANPADGLSPQLQALMRMAEMQNGGSTARVDALPLVKLMIARSNCFRVADRGEAFSALERERAINGGTATTRPVTKADYLIEVKDGSKPAAQQKLTPKEQSFQKNWRGQWSVVNSVDDVALFVKAWKSAK